MARGAWLVVAVVLSGGGWRCRQPGADVSTHRGFAAPRSLAAADLDGDRDLDVVVAESTGRATILENDGRGTLRRAREALDAGPEPTHVRAVDVDRDGDVDLLFANHETSRITRLENDGRGRFAPPAA